VQAHVSRDYAKKFAASASLAYFQDNCGVYLRAVVLFACGICVVLLAVSDVLAARNPPQVFRAVVVANVVDVIHFVPRRRRQAVECEAYQLMHRAPCAPGLSNFRRAVSVGNGAALHVTARIPKRLQPQRRVKRFLVVPQPVNVSVFAGQIVAVSRDLPHP